jgi:hypothetical protein
MPQERLLCHGGRQAAKHVPSRIDDGFLHHTYTFGLGRGAVCHQIGHHTWNHTFTILERVTGAARTPKRASNLVVRFFAFE